jgi:hypothetical protein
MQAMRYLPPPLLLVIAFGCSTEPATSRSPSPTPPKTPRLTALVVELPPDHPAATDIRALIEKLAISNDKATYDPVYSPSRDTPKTDKRLIAYDAAEQLVAYGVEAFPYLLQSLRDNRQSVPFRRVLPSTVGDACYTLITRQLYALPDAYAGSIYRDGADGKLHGRPVFDKDLFRDHDLEQWLRQRQGKSLEELQLEALSWVLAEEEKIGVAEPDDETRILQPLRRKVAELKSTIAARKLP